MKKICILSAVNIKHMSMISIYTEILKKKGVKFDIIYMDKYGEREEIDAENKYVFTNIINKKDRKINKVSQYFKLRKFAIPILEKNEYDFIIVWNDIAIVIFADYLAKKWKNRYCLNIRDYCGEKNPFIYLRFKEVIQNSAFTTISSEGFKKFLPPHNYIHIHSLNTNILSKVAPRKELVKSDRPIRISFIGNIRFFEINKKLLEIFKNDVRFELHFYGTNANILEKYAKENKINNAVFQDSFPVKDTHLYINKADLINNLYGSNSIDLDYALSIKLYYGLYNRTPILVNSGTYSEEFVSKYNIGFVVDKIDDMLPEKLYDWYGNLDFSIFNTSCEDILREITEHNKKFEIYVNEYIV